MHDVSMNWRRKMSKIKLLIRVVSSCSGKTTTECMTGNENLRRSQRRKPPRCASAFASRDVFIPAGASAAVFGYADVLLSEDTRAH